ncbi:MAG: AI-2E family transporter [Propionibacteriaceae bacterium]
MGTLVGASAGGQSPAATAQASPQHLSRGLLIAIGLAAVLVAALGLRAFAGVVAPVFLALVLSITVQPLRRLPARHGLPTWIGVVLSLVAVYLIVLVLIVTLVLSGVQLAGLLEDYAPQFQATLQSLGATLEAAGVSQSQLEAVKSAIDPGQLIGVVTALLGGVAGILGSIAFLVLLLFFTVTDAATFATNLAKVSPAGRRLAEAFQLFARGSRQYLAVATIFGAGVALCDVVGLIVLDIRYAWLWGLLAFVTNYIPNVGFLIGLLPPTIVALLDHDVETAIAVVIFYTVLNIVIQSVIQPRVVGSTVGLSGTLSFLSLLIWTTILGGVGALLAVPASLFVKALFIDVDPERRWLTPLLSSSMPSEPAVDEPPGRRARAADPGDVREAAAEPDALPGGPA